ncbi:DUF4232 domain-containing protein [Kitasatospora sp. NPDC002040]|uniref:DUF4232 domain-containing protein n=1 Tax=Kitasatospora sp. NPDC002040 TaxID=3154661 RepID=UPI00332F3E32
MNSWGRTAACAILLYAAAACAAPAPLIDPAEQQAAPAQTAPAVPPAAAPAAAPAQAVPSSAAAPASAQPQARSTTPPRRCTAADLSALGLAGGRGAPGAWEDFTVTVSLHNNSPSSCRLRGWPGISTYGDTTVNTCAKGDLTPGCGMMVSTTVPRTMTVEPPDPATVTDVDLVPGGNTVFGLHYRNPFGPRCEGGRLWTAPYGGEIRIPGDPKTVPLLPFPNTQACDGLFRVTAFGVPG